MGHTTWSSVTTCVQMVWSVWKGRISYASDMIQVLSWGVNISDSITSELLILYCIIQLVVGICNVRLFFSKIYYSTLYQFYYGIVSCIRKKTPFQLEWFDKNYIWTHQLTGCQHVYEFLIMSDLGWVKVIELCLKLPQNNLVCGVPSHTWRTIVSKIIVTIQHWLVS